MPLGTGLVRRTKDIGKETLGQETAGNTISLDIRLLHAAGDVATRALVLGLVDGQRTRGAVRLGSNAEGEGKGSGDDGELHFDLLKRRYLQRCKKMFIYITSEEKGRLLEKVFLLCGWMRKKPD